MRLGIDIAIVMWRGGGTAQTDRNDPPHGFRPVGGVDAHRHKGHLVHLEMTDYEMPLNKR